MLTPLEPAATNKPTWTCVIAGQKVTCTFKGGTVKAGTTLPTISIKVKVTATASGALDSTGYLSSSDATKKVTSTDYAEVVGVPVLELAMTASPTGDLATPGTVTYTLKASVSATFASESQAPVITDNFPAGVFTTVTATGTKWSCVRSGTQAAGFTETCTWTGGHLAAGASLTTLTFKGKTPTGITVGTTANNSATIRSNDASPVTVVNYAEVGHAAAPNLGVTATGLNATSVGTTYSITIKPSILSTGSAATHDPVVTVTVPTGEKFTSTPTPTTWTCVRSTTTRKLTCTSKKATPIAKGTVLQTIVATVKATTAGSYVTDVKFADTTDKAIPVSTSVTTNVTAVPVLTVAISGVPAHGSVLGTYTVTASSKLKATGGPAYHHPVVTLTVTATYEKFTGTVTQIVGQTPVTSWTCAKTSTVKITCTSKLTLPIAAGTTLGKVTAKAKFVAVHGTEK